MKITIKLVYLTRGWMSVDWFKNHNDKKYIYIDRTWYVSDNELKDEIR